MLHHYFNLNDMKKISLTVLFTIASAFVLNVYAQAHASFGLKLNGNITNVKFSDLQKGNSCFKPGVSSGGFAKIAFRKNFAVQPELLFSYTTAKIHGANNQKLKFKYASVEIPVYMLAEHRVGQGKAFIGIGPHIGYGFSVDTRTEKLPDEDPNANKVELSHFYLGGGTLAGYEFRAGWSIHAGYKLGYDLSSKNKASNAPTQVVSLGVGYRF